MYRMNHPFITCFYSTQCFR